MSGATVIQGQVLGLVLWVGSGMPNGLNAA